MAYEKPNDIKDYSDSQLLADAKQAREILDKYPELHQLSKLMQKGNF